MVPLLNWLNHLVGGQSEEMNQSQKGGCGPGPPPLQGDSGF